MAVYYFIHSFAFIVLWMRAANYAHDYDHVGRECSHDVGDSRGTYNRFYGRNNRSP